jgi:hypothetical protein
MNKIRKTYISKNFNQSRCRDMGGHFIRGGRLTQPNRSASDSSRATDQLVLSTTGRSGPLSDGGRIHCRCEGAKDAAWIQQILPELGQQNITPTMRLDNEAAGKVTQTSPYHRRTRHIEHRYHYVREEVQKGHLKIIGVLGLENLADPEGGAWASTHGMETDNWGDIFSAEELEWIEM